MRAFGTWFEIILSSLPFSIRLLSIVLLLFIRCGAASNLSLFFWVSTSSIWWSRLWEGFLGSKGRFFCYFNLCHTVCLFHSFCKLVIFIFFSTHLFQFFYSGFWNQNHPPNFERVFSSVKSVCKFYQKFSSTIQLVVNIALDINQDVSMYVKSIKFWIPFRVLQMFWHGSLVEWKCIKSQNYGDATFVSPDYHL